MRCKTRWYFDSAKLQLQSNLDDRDKGEKGKELDKGNKRK